MSQADLDPIDWERQRAFLAVWRTGSLSAAARALGVAQPTLRRRIDELERQLGTTLFVRSSGGLAPSSLAKHLVEHAEAMEVAASAFARAGSGESDAPAGVVRIAASELVGAEILPAIVRRLRETYPDLRVEVSLSDDVEDLLSRRADVAVRMTAPGAEDLMARRLADMQLGLFVRADLLAGHSPPLTLEEATGLPAIGYETETIPFRRLRAAGLPLPWRNAVFVTNSGLGQLAAIRAGVGMGASLVAVCGSDPDLVHLVPDTFTATLETWLVFPKELRSVRRVRIIVDALAAALGRDV